MWREFYWPLPRSLIKLGYSTRRSSRNHSFHARLPRTQSCRNSNREFETRKTRNNPSCPASTFAKEKLPCSLLIHLTDLPGLLQISGSRYWSNSPFPHIFTWQF